VNEFVVVLSMYLGIVPCYARLQRRLASRQREDAMPAAKDDAGPVSVDVIVTCYNERPARLARCLAALQEQDHPGRINVWVVDDGSQNRAELLPVLAANSRPGWQVLLTDKNYGKRVAQAFALQEGDGELVVTVDSDTIVASDGIRQIVTPFRRPDVGAVTSLLHAANAEDSWLSQEIDTRYGLLCDRERAAQGFFGSVLCCAGPFSAFRRTAVQRVRKRYLARRGFNGQRRSGDDLELTNLVLGEGYRSEYRPAAVAWTYVPATFLEFARQQRRWNRSFYCELPRMLRIVAKRHPYMVLDVAARALVPALFAAGLLIAAADVLRAPHRLVLDAAAIALMVVTSVELLPSLDRAGRRFALRYGLVFVGLLLPVRFWSACTVLLRDRWGTRKLRDRAFPELAEQATSMALSDVVALPLVEGDGVVQLARRFTPTAAEA
jgi:N-acetylglucosaminyltransferase